MINLFFAKYLEYLSFLFCPSSLRTVFVEDAVLMNFCLLYLKGMTVLELNDLVKACEEEFGVSAAAGVVVAAAGAEGGAAGEENLSST